MVHGLSCFVACGIFLDQGLNLGLLHWQLGSLPLSCQGSWSFLFFNISIYSYTFPPSTAFTASCKFWYVMFLVSFVSTHFISLVISSLNNGLFEYMLFNFHKFVSFPVSLLLFLTSSCYGRRK